MRYNLYILRHHEYLLKKTIRWDEYPPVTAEDFYQYAQYQFEILDYEKAYRWFKKALENGVYDALYELSVFYRFGLYVEKNKQTADEYANKFFQYVQAKKEELKKLLDLEKKAKQQYQIGMCLRYGWGCVKNEEEAFLYLQKASKYRGEALYEVGLIYKEGSCGQQKNIEVAKVKLKKAYYEQLYGLALKEYDGLCQREEKDEIYIRVLQTMHSYTLGRFMRVVKESPGEDAFLRLAKMYAIPYPEDTPQGKERSLQMAEKYKKIAEKYKKT